jgi:PHP family Zn ribbon phosphoesterase
MMLTITDLPIHLPYSLAVSSKSTLPSLERWARIKGIHLVGTGDCTHPVWLHQAREHLEDAEEGLFTLRPSVRDAFEAGPTVADHLPAKEDRY